jgi:hypothetical protein
VKIYLLERCPLVSSEVVLDCNLGALELDFLFSGGLYPLCFACPKCDLSAENQNRNLSGHWVAKYNIENEIFLHFKKASQFFIDLLFFQIFVKVFYQTIWPKKLLLRSNPLHKWWLIFLSIISCHRYMLYFGYLRNNELFSNFATDIKYTTFSFLKIQTLELNITFNRQ